eukprot:TRINITY_DN168_c1_g1_i1.p1 TRINITY_DN168_c1_g1~~TRINITY_DN168_c1_g1_i1.p1  ORF type:complete len:1756 (+),score=296.81 TRINITY_DN168_c1_g1_i1:117-5384(+)
MSRLRMGSEHARHMSMHNEQYQVLKRPIGASPRGSIVHVVQAERNSLLGQEILAERNGENLKNQLSTICANVDNILGDFVDEVEEEDPFVATGISGPGLSYQLKLMEMENQKLTREIEGLRKQIEDMSTQIDRPPTTPMKVFRPETACVASQTDTVQQPPEEKPIKLQPKPKLVIDTDSAIPSGKGNSLDIEEYLKAFHTAKSLAMKPAEVGEVPKGSSLGIACISLDSFTIRNVIQIQPSEALASLGRAFELIRDLATTHGGYECCNDSEALEITFVFAMPEQAVSFASAVHIDLMSVSWCKRILAEQDFAIKRNVDGDLMWRGIPPRIGVHTGIVNSRYDETLERHTCYGSCVDTAVEICEVARPGETIITQEVTTITNKNEVSLTSINAQQAEAGWVQCLPNRLSKRSFPVTYPKSPRVAKSRSNKGDGIPERSLSNRSKLPPMGHVTLVLLDVPDAETLWNETSKVMASAIHKYQSIVRETLLLFDGFEVRSEQDGFMLCFHSENNAVLFALDLQSTTHAAKWPPQLSEHPLCKSKRDVWNGLRIRCAIHSGYTLSIPDPVTGVMEYWGPTTAMVSRLVSHAEGGQTIITETSFDKTLGIGIPFSSSPLPPVKLEGLSQGPISIMELFPAKLARRKMQLAETRCKSRWSESSFCDPKKMETSTEILKLMSNLTRVDGKIIQEGVETERALTKSVEATTRIEMPPTVKATLALVEIADCQELWERDHKTMTAASVVFSECLTRIAKHNDGYVAHHINECFLIAFHHEKDGLFFSISLQEALLDAPWPPQLLSMQGCREAFNNSTGSRIWRGLRTSISLHSGSPISLPHPVSGKMDYWGPMVTKALSLGSITEGGEILATTEVWRPVERNTIKIFTNNRLLPVVKELPLTPLPDIKEPASIVRIIPSNLSGRVFSQLEPSYGNDSKPRALRAEKSKWSSSIYKDRVRNEAASDILRKMATLYGTALPTGVRQEIKTNIGAPVGTVTLVFTDIQSSTALWEKNAQVMLNSIQLHNQVMRETIDRHNGYEVKTEGDAFMVSFHTERDAAFFCLDAQLQLVNAPWSEQLLSLDTLVNEVLATKQNKQKHIWRGLRMRVGAHTGCPTCLPDPVSGRMDYWGPMVNKSARISSIATGGQVVFSTSVYDKCRKELEESGAVSRDLGHFELKGISGKTQVFEVLPNELKERVFPERTPKSVAPRERKKSRHPPVPPNGGRRNSQPKRRTSQPTVKERPPTETPTRQSPVRETPTSQPSSPKLKMEAPKIELPPRDTPVSSQTPSPVAQFPERRASVTSLQSAGSEPDLLALKDSLAVPEDNFTWTSANSKYVDMNAISHAAAINRLIVGGLMEKTIPQPATISPRAQAETPTGEPSNPAKPQRRVSVSVNVPSPVEELKRQMEEDSSVAQFLEAPTVKSVCERVGSMSPGTVRRTSIPSQRRRSIEFNDVPVTEGIRELGKMIRKRRSSLGSNMSEESAPDDVIAYESTVHAGLITMMAQVEKQKMEAEDTMLHGARGFRRGSDDKKSINPSQFAKASKTALAMNRWITIQKRKSLPFDMWDSAVEVQSHNHHNEWLGFTLLHHQIARLHIKIQEFYAKIELGEATPEVRRDFEYECLLCVNPRVAKERARTGSLEDMFDTYVKAVIKAEDASKSRIGVTKCRSSIIGMALQWATWLSKVSSGVEIEPPSGNTETPPVGPTPPPHSPSRRPSDHNPHRMHTQLMRIQQNSEVSMSPKAKRRDSEPFPLLQNKGYIRKRAF